ncbi:signal peptide containing protein [Theileria equi strain WA]|uniref:Signal peptide containing protein n=1 Tax=Theileria equi strain WA TaxID=1537102 RepID=L1LES3_THEEQ|nr:signal peptide containing protein [Theileria equi strain WA]EKX73942.1 signal peptide containing protein [Theileria equi strain WA]|eukprot:XP_004833394.1 signal peptide containing protein [Theileria equi strain WA]
MNSLVIFYLVCILELCHCGDSPSSEEIPKNSSESDCSDPVIVDLSYPDPYLFQIFDHNYNDNEIRLIAPHKDVVSSTVMVGDQLLWTAREGKKFEYSKIYLDAEGKFALIFVANDAPEDMEKNYFELKEGRWVSCPNTYLEVIKRLKIPVEKKGEITIRLEEREDTDILRVFDSYVLGANAIRHFPRPGYICKNVTYRGKSLWSAAEGTNEVCLSSAIYPNGESPLVLLATRGDGNMDCLCFERVGDYWNEISGGEFDEKVDAITGGDIDAADYR